MRTKTYHEVAKKIKRKSQVNKKMKSIIHKIESEKKEN